MLINNLLREKWVKYINTSLKRRLLWAVVIGLLIAASVIFTKDANAFFIRNVAASSWDFFTIRKDKEYSNEPLQGDVYVQALSSIGIQTPNIKQIGPTKNKIFLPGDDNPRVAGQCVNYVKYVTGIEYSGNAFEWVKYINSDSPTKYSIAVIRAGKWGHIGLVVDDDYSDGRVTIRSRNWEGLWIISDDEFDIDDLRIAGYIRY